MKRTKKKSPVSVSQLVTQTKAMFMHHHHGWGLVVLAVVLVAVSLLCSVRPGRTARVIYPAGEIAAADVVADRDMMVEDPQATQVRRDRALALQPMVFDIDKKGLESFRSESLGLLEDINKRGLDEAGLDDLGGRIVFDARPVGFRRNNDAEVRIRRDARQKSHIGTLFKRKRIHDRFRPPVIGRSSNLPLLSETPLSAESRTLPHPRQLNGLEAVRRRHRHPSVHEDFRLHE